MADYEKVIKGLETCRTRVNCKECPYAYDKRANDSYCEAVLHNDVLELLKWYKEHEHDVCVNCPVGTDYTEIVRCKDCRHGYICENNVRCENRNNPAMIGQHNGFDWFCADGERKSTQTNAKNNALDVR